MYLWMFRLLEIPPTGKLLSNYYLLTSINIFAHSAENFYKYRDLSDAKIKYRQHKKLRFMAIQKYLAHTLLL